MLGRDNGTRRSWRVFKATIVSIVCRDEHRLSPQLRERILEWMQHSSEHLGQLLKADRFIRYIGRQRLLDRRPEIPAPKRSPGGIALFPRRGILIGGVTAAALILGLRISTTQQSDEPIQHKTLPDGSVMHVLRGSDVSIEFDRDVRLINLPHGEAVFEVAKDPDRPFVVRSQTSETIAVGTRFGIAASSRDTTTTVSEGKVRVVPVGADRATGTAVRAGELLRVAAGSLQPEPVLAVNAERRISWAAGWLEFEGESAGEAVKAFNRFINVRIEITRPELYGAQLRYGRFEIEKPGKFASAVATALGAPVTLDSKRNVIYIGEPAPLE